MGNDVFNEQLVKKEKTVADLMQFSLIWAVTAVLSIVVNLFIPYVGMMIAVLIIWAGLHFSGKVNKEFEYIFTNGDLDIDIIYNKAKRKRAITLDTTKILEMKKVADKERSKEGFDKILDYSSGKPSDNLYALIYHVDYKKARIFIEPNDAIRKAIYQYAPRTATGYYGIEK